MRSNKDWLIERAIKQQEEMERNPAYKMLRKQIEEEQGNPTIRYAREQLDREARSPALQMARQRMEEEQRNPGLRIVREKLEQESQNPFLSIARRLNEQSRFDTLYQISNRSLRELERYPVNERLRDWERKLPDWVLNPTRHQQTSFDVVLGNLSHAERLAERFAMTAHIELRDVGRLRDWDKFVALSREVSTAFRALPPEMNNTFLVRANEKLELIRESAEKHDSTSLDQEFDAFIDYVFSWIKSLGPKALTREAVRAILITIMVATFQVGLSYKWRLDDKESADQQAELQNKKLDAVLEALLDQKKNQKLIIGKPYAIERTTGAFARPGSRQRPVGYVFAGQSVLAIATTGRWILVEYADRFSLERRLGWIRKKYAKLATTNISVSMSEDEIRLRLAITLYEEGKLSLGQAAHLASLPKRDFIDILGQHHVPVLNYSADDLREEIGV